MMLSGVDIAKAYNNQRALLIAVKLYAEAVEAFKQRGLQEPQEVIRTYTEMEEVRARPRIVVDPFDTDRLNPNSYNLRLAPEIVTYPEYELDVRKKPQTEQEEIPEEGLVLQPGVLYLAHTMEYTESWNCVPAINGRSSTGRLGLCVHVTAGFGDVGFCGTWTLEMTVVKPLRVYAGMEVCQINWHTVSPKHEVYKGKYLGGRKPMASELHKEHDEETGD